MSNFDNGFIDSKIDDAAVELTTALIECIRDLDADSLYKMGQLLLMADNPAVIKFGNILRLIEE